MDRPESTSVPHMAYELDSFQCIRTVPTQAGADATATQYPIQLIISSTQQRSIYFETEQAQAFWHKTILSAQGYLDKRIS